MSGTHNILVISDLHLGEDLTPAATPQSTRDLRLAERCLVDFLTKYTRLRADGRPWRLVINGDMIDFLSICVFPDQHDLLQGVTCSEDEREHGLERRKDAACAKVALVVDRHVEFFRALVRFVAAGNAVEILCGNHDTEFCWPEVQDALIHGVVRVWRAMPATGRGLALTEARIREAVRFHAWFYYEPGVVWIEHGHQYDECCSFEYNLHPADAEDKAIVSNVDTAGMRYVTNQIADATPHGTEEWSFLGYVRFALGLGRRGAFRLVRGYMRCSAKLLGEWRAGRVSRLKRLRRARHMALLSTLSQTTPLSEATLRELDSMQRPPVITNLRKLLQVLMLDKLLIGLGALLVVLGSLVWLPLLWATVASTAVMLGSHWLNQHLGRDRMIDAALPMQFVPSRILERVDAEFVIFGHTHLPTAQRIATAPRKTRGRHERWYFNTGTWMPIGKQGLLRSFTHVVIRHAPGGAVARLCQWRDGASRKFTPDWSPVRGLAAQPLAMTSSLR